MFIGVTGITSFKEFGKETEKMFLNNNVIRPVYKNSVKDREMIENLTEKEEMDYIGEQIVIGSYGKDYKNLRDYTDVNKRVEKKK